MNTIYRDTKAAGNPPRVHVATKLINDECGAVQRNECPFNWDTVTMSRITAACNEAHGQQVKWPLPFTSPALEIYLKKVNPWWIPAAKAAPGTPHLCLSSGKSLTLCSHRCHGC